MIGSRIQIQSVLKRAFLRQLVLGSIQTGVSLLVTFQNAQGAVNSPTFQKGRIVVHQSGSGQSGSFQTGFAGAQWTQENVFGLIEEFIDLYFYLINFNQTNGTPLPADNGQEANSMAIFEAMRQDDSLAGITEQMGDWTGLNVPSLGGVPNAG